MSTIHSYVTLQVLSTLSDAPEDITKKWADEE